MMINPVQPKPCTILGVTRESEHEWTFRVQSDAKPSHGQFMQLSIPKIGEAPISVSAQGDDWLEFTIRSVGKVTDSIFHKTAGDTLFLRGPYGKGWPVEEFAGSISLSLPAAPASPLSVPCCACARRRPASFRTSI